LALDSKEVVWQQSIVSKEKRLQLNRHKSFIIWLTGLSGAGKSTIATNLEFQLHQSGIRTYLLDGDNIRHGLCKDLGFRPEDRQENIRRVSEIAKLFVDAGQVVVTALISPYITDREMARNLVNEDEFVEVYVKCPLYECERRDPKGLYQKARSGMIPNFTGISAPYEEPLAAEVVVESDKQTVEESVKQILGYLREANLL